jgi:glycosyltransferase involved in cell wall biosynthesis
MDENEPLRILHLASSQRWTGAAEPAAGLAARQMAHGHEVAFACIGGSSFERRLEARGVPMVGGFHFDRRLDLGRLREDVGRLRRHVDEHRPHIIHCHLPHDHWVAALALRRPFSRMRRMATPAIVRTMHREAAPRRDLPHRILVGKATDMTIVVSESSRRAMVDEVGLPSPKVALVRGAVDLERFRPGLSPSVVREMCKIPAEAHVAGMVARMQPHRGHQLLIDVVEDVVAGAPRALLALAGRGELKQTLKSRIHAHPLRHHLKRIGYLKQHLPELYAALDVVVLMVPGSDGSCRAMLEAMACGRPVIGARIGAMADAIEPGGNGWLFEKGDRDGLTRALVEALGDEEKTRAMGDAARRYVEGRHSPEGQYAETMVVYWEALGRRGKKR